MKRKRWPALVAIVASLTAVAGCGDDDGESGGGGGEGGGESVIRFVQAPDPVWEYMKDKGIVQRAEKKSGIKIETMDTFDYFALFVGGHADVTSANSYQTPLFDVRGVPTVTFGKYNASKDLMIVAADSDYKTAADLPEGCKIAVETLTGNAIIWAALVKEIDGRELAENSDDLSFVTAEVQEGPNLVTRGDACAAITDPTQIAPALRTGKVRPLYDGKSASQLFGEQISPGHEGVDTNDFVATKEWFDEHPREVAFFLKLWQRGVDLWKNDANAIIEAQPEGFGIQDAADEKFMEDYVANVFDFFHESVYLDKKWIEGERGVFDLIQAAGIIPEDQPYNEMAIVDPKTGKVTETLGGEGN